MGEAESVVTNAVVLVLGVSTFNSNVHEGGIYSHIKLVVLQCIGNLQCYATLKSSRTDGQTYTYTQPQYNSFATASGLN